MCVSVEELILSNLLWFTWILISPADENGRRKYNSATKIAAPPPPCNPDTPCIASAPIRSQPQNSLFQICPRPTPALFQPHSLYERILSGSIGVGTAVSADVDVLLVSCPHSRRAKATETSFNVCQSAAKPPLCRGFPPNSGRQMVNEFNCLVSPTTAMFFIFRPLIFLIVSRSRILRGLCASAGLDWCFLESCAPCRDPLDKMVSGKGPGKGGLRNSVMYWRGDQDALPRGSPGPASGARPSLAGFTKQLRWVQPGVTITTLPWAPKSDTLLAWLTLMQADCPSTRQLAVATFGKNIYNA